MSQEPEIRWCVVTYDYKMKMWREMFGSRSKDRYGALDNLEKWKNPNYGHSYARAKLRIARVRTTYEVEE